MHEVDKNCWERQWAETAGGDSYQILAVRKI